MTAFRSALTAILLSVGLYALIAASCYLGLSVLTAIAGVLP